MGQRGGAEQRGRSVAQGMLWLSFTLSTEVRWACFPEARRGRAEHCCASSSIAVLPFPRTVSLEPGKTAAWSLVPLQLPKQLERTQVCALEV